MCCEGCLATVSRKTGETTLKLHWLLPGLIGALCVAAPAKAGQLTTWQFDANQNRLEFTTDEDVQPRAQLVFDPTRLVIDLPGIYLGSSPVTQEIGEAIQQVRIGQFDQQTTRVVIELAPGYVIDPQQVRFRGISPTQWIVQLPTPQRSDASTATPANSTRSATAPQASGQASSSSSSRSTSSSSAANLNRSTSSSTSRSSSTNSSQTASSTNPTSRRSASVNSTRSSASTQSPRTTAAVSADSSTQINRMQVTAEGLLLSTTGSKPSVEIERSRSGRSITIRLSDARLASGFGDRDREVDRHGVDQIEVDQDGNAVEIKLDVDRRSPDWEARLGDRGSILLEPVPTETVVSEKAAADPLPPTSIRAATPAIPTTTPAPITVAEQPSPARQPAASTTAPRTQLAMIQGIDLDVSSNRLLIQADRPVSHQAQWQSGMYVITLSPAQLADQVKGPQLTPADPLRRVRLRQSDNQTVMISIQPASGVQFGDLNLVTPQMLALEVQRPTPAAPRTSANSSNLGLSGLVPNGRLVVVLDPGHGGVDPGAVGIGDIQEADLVLPIAQQVASLLQQQGIQVVMTRNSDVDVELEPRVQMAEQARANLFVSIHANSVGLDRPEVNGTETYYYSSGEALAQVIQNSVVSMVGTNDRGVRQARFYVLRKTSMPAVLVETAYVSGSEDAPRLADPNFRSQMATAIARGILQYIQQQSLTGSR